MKPDIIKKPTAVITELLDEAAEHPIECDILLPDYCPDIVRVLTCRADADITNRSVNGTTLTIDGMTTVTLCYAGEVGGVRKTTVRQPFSKSFELAAAPNAPVVFASAQRSALSCRAVSRRRVDVRGVLQISASVYDSKTEEIVSETKSDTLCLLTKERECECVTENAISRFSLREEVTPTPGVEKVSEIIRCECYPLVGEWRAVSGGILIKGELMISMLASCEEEKLSPMKYTLPISRLIESRNPESVRDVSLKCAFVECQPTDEEDGRLSVEMQFEAALLHAAKGTVTAAKDAFSTRYAHEQKETTLTELSVSSAIKEKLHAQSKAAVPDGTEGVCDVCASVSQLSCKASGGELKLTGRVTFAALVTVNEGGVQAASASTLFEKTVMSVGEENCTCYAEPAVLSADAVISEDGITFDADVLVAGVLLKRNEWSALSDIAVDENSPRGRDTSVGMIIRYADEGEKIWDIASHYAVSPDDIMRDNSLESDVISADSVLIISAPTA